MKALKTSGRGLPTWFRALCSQASVRAELAPGHHASYADPGYHLAIHWWGELEHFDRRNASKALKKIRHDDAPALVSWLGEYLPDFLALVPPRRRLVLARGFFTRQAE